MASNYVGNVQNQAPEEGFAVNERRMRRCSAWVLAVGILGTGLALAQAPAQPGQYQPKFSGDPARSDSESQALGYMRVVLRAQRAYEKKHEKYAQSLEDLAGSGSFTKRMAHSTDRGDYTASFRTHKDGFILTMTPKQLDAQHRSFYAEEDGAIHADDQKPADIDSPKVK
jgi:hypothetical protein